MKITLSYVNKTDRMIVIDKNFDTLVEVAAWVDIHHPQWTSYDIIVTRARAA